MTERGAALLLFSFWFVLIGAYVVKEGSKPPPKPRVLIVQPPVEVPKSLKDWI
jgi:hypothetical protein